MIGIEIDQDHLYCYVSISNAVTSCDRIFFWYYSM